MLLLVVCMVAQRRTFLKQSFTPSGHQFSKIFQSRSAHLFAKPARPCHARALPVSAPHSQKGSELMGSPPVKSWAALLLLTWAKMLSGSLWLRLSMQIMIRSAQQEVHPNFDRPYLQQGWQRVVKFDLNDLKISCKKAR